MNFQVELTSYCDLTCGYCPNKDMQRRREFMTDDVWETILHMYIVPFRHVNRHCPPTFIGHKDGEPLLNKRLPDRLLSLSHVAPDMKIDIYSHGLLLPVWRVRGRDFMDFLSTLPNQVRYMMSYHPRNHDNTHNDYSKVIEYMRDVLQSPPCNVEFITVSHRSRYVSEEMQDAWGKVWAGLPITVHKNASINPWTGRIQEEGTTRFNGCPYADFGHWFFGVTGNVIACCLDLEEEIVFGNVMKDDPSNMFDKTWEFYAEQKRILNSGAKVTHQVCANCFGQDVIPVEMVQLGMRAV